jgi:hypothetical protein
MNRQQLAGTIPLLDEAAMAAAQVRQNFLTKPQGSLGRLEAISVQLAGITGQPRPSVARKAVIVMGGGPGGDGRHGDRQHDPLGRDYRRVERPAGGDRDRAGDQ